MNYTKLDKGNYRIHLIETDKFKTVSMRICFKRPLEEKMITEREILSGILTNSTAACPTLKDLIMQKEDLYQLGFGYSTKHSGRYMIVTGGVKFIHEKYTEKGMNEKSMRFFLDSLFHPNAENHSFNQNAFALEQRNYLEFLEQKDDNPNQYALKRFRSLIGKGTPLCYDPSGDAEILKGLDEKKLYQVYLDMLENDQVDIFIIGNISMNFVETILAEYFQNRKAITYEEGHFLTLQDMEYEEVVDHQDFKQSKLKICYDIKDLTDFERKYVLPVYNFVLGGDSDSLLFKEIREKNSLCYDVHSAMSPMYSYIVINAGIEAKDYEKTVELVKKQMQKMEEGDFKEEDIAKVKLNYQTSYKEIMDSPNGILNLYESHEYVGYNLVPDRIASIERVTKENITDLAKKIHLKAIYFLEGNDDDEKRD